MTAPALPPTAEARAALSLGQSDAAIHGMVRRALGEGRASTLLDVGCGQGTLARSLSGLYESYVGVDLVAYEGFPKEPWARFVPANLDKSPYSELPDGAADLVCSVETIEHLENPRAFVRELVRLCRPGGTIVVTTPNQLSWLSKVTLLVKNQWNAFQEPWGYPAHLTALLEIDLLRIARECRLEAPRIIYTNVGRIPFTPWRWPRLFRGRRFSDNVGIVARRPA